MDNLHFIQMQILRELAFKPQAVFADLNLDKHPSDIFSYHLKTLIKQGLIQKQATIYQLTPKGKTFITHMDTATKRIEHLPKVSVLAIAVQDNKFAVHIRSKEPYFGYAGFPSGKVRFGETIAEAAKRELEEEMGLANLIKKLSG